MTEDFYALGFYAGIEALEHGVYNCQSCMEYLETFYKIESQSTHGQNFIRGWKEAL